MDTLMQLVTKGNDFLWSFLLLVLLCGTGLYYTVRLRFIQVRKFGEGVRQVFGHFSMNGEKHEKGEMTPFQSIATAIAAQVGTGNLAGAATALIGGGPGAIFWMWISAFLGMATIYGEAVLAQTYKTEVNGEVTGGPVYYIKAAFKGTFGKVLSTLFAVFIILALGFMGNMVQSNSIGAAFVEAFQVFHVEISPVIVGVVVAVIAAVIFLGGTKSLATVVEKIVPIMAGVYIVGSLVLICMTIPGSITRLCSSICWGCTSLKQLILEDGAGNLYISLNNTDFKDCPLEYIYIGRNIADSEISEIEYHSAFDDIPTLKKAEFGNITKIPSKITKGIRSSSNA